ncbi:hypothetical protein M3Y99_01228200 [Aphelenchoides fujianensis]|nr:hypothetical protein M3Y99_01228200 [Aphelenchoides fujianensis]
MSDPKTAEGTKDVPSQPKKELLLSVDPERASFLPTGSRSEHMIANLGEKRAAVKPEMLRIPMNCVAPEDAPCVGPPAEKK